ncbi:LysE family translocator [Thalassospira profundimaris]|nr:LysE family translocator [Thalassospira profundimaris]
MSGSLSLYLSMATFALVSSITPGPVTILVLGSSVKYGFQPALRPVFGATAGFCLLLLIVGFGLHQLIIQVPEITLFIKWAGVAFLGWLSWKLATDNGKINTERARKSPSVLAGAAVQWLNPKAWMASVAGTGVFIADGDRVLLWQFVILYFVVCFSSVALWAVAGSFLRHYLHNDALVRIFNRCMAALLLACAIYLLLH